jgi:hypothetical protein
MNPFVVFMQTPLGRVIRIVGGLAMIAAGPVGLGGLPGYALAALGLVPLTAGLFDFCAMAPIFRVPWSGATIRAMSQQKARGGAGA